MNNYVGPANFNLEIKSFVRQQLPYKIPVLHQAHNKSLIFVKLKEKNLVRLLSKKLQLATVTTKESQQENTNSVLV